MTYDLFKIYSQRTWKSIGVILSILWIFGAIYYEYSSTDISAKNFSEFSNKVCVKSVKIGRANDLMQCELQRQENYNSWMKNVWVNAFTLALIPLPFYWIYGFILLTLSRCFINGARTELNLDGLGRCKKWFYYFCYGFSGFSVFVAAVVLMNIYADSKVPVSLGYKTSIIETDDEVRAEGTWAIYSELPGDSKNIILFPQQTSKIICEKNKRQCLESRAMISDITSSALLMTDLIEYEVTSWTKDNIVFVKNDLCFDSIFTLDLNSKTVSGIEKYSNKLPNGEYCVKPESSTSNTIYKLSDGFAVHEQLRREASPWFLKVVYSIFGN